MIGFALLANVARVVVMSSPLPFAWGVEPPLQLGMHLPYALIVPICVGGALAGHVNYRTKQPREEWTHAAVKGGWTLFDQANYVPWRFRAMAKFWSGAPGRYTLCDKYFLYFSRNSTHPN